MTNEDYGIGKREIRFRAWNTNGNQMVDLYKITPLALEIKQDGVFVPFGEQYKIMQFTGLKDRKGKEIWEGDIITMSPNNDCHNSEYIVVFEDGKFVLRGKDNDETEWFSTPNIKETVIGNIFQNKDLINKL